MRYEPAATPLASTTTESAEGDVRAQGDAVEDGVDVGTCELEVGLGEFEVVIDELEVVLDERVEVIEVVAPKDPGHPEGG